MNLEEILGIVERVGSDDPSTLAELEAAKTELARLIHAEARSDSPDLAVLTSMRAAFGELGTAVTQAQAEEDARQEEISQLLAEVNDPDAAAEAEAEAEEADGEAEGAEEAEGEAEDAEAEEVEVITPEEVIEPEKTPVAASATRTIPLRDAVARVRQRPPAPAPQEANGGVDGQVFLLGERVNAVPTLREIAGAFEQVTRSPSTGKATLLRFDAALDPARTLPGDTAANTRMLNDLIGPEAVAAAGGCCSLPTPIRNQNVINSSARPLRDSLPTIGVQDTGAVTYFPDICMPTQGAAVWLCDDDAAVDFDDDATWKECAFIECAEIETTIVDAIYKCLTIGEFQRRFATERWVAVLAATLALQSRVAEAKLWSDMLAKVNSTHAGPSTGAFFVNWYQTVQLAADSIREQQRILGNEVQLHVWQPHWVRGAIASDLVARRIVDIDNPTAVDSMIAGAAANAGVMVTTLGPDQQFIEVSPQANGPLQPYPDTASMIMAPEGHYSFLDGGQFDLGIEIRDLDLARQNAVAAFAESFEGVLARGCNAKRLDIPVDICSEAAGCVGS